MYQIICTQHNCSSDIIGVDIWSVEKMPDPLELANEVFARFGECHTALVSVNVDEIPFPLYMILVEGSHDGKQN